MDYNNYRDYVKDDFGSVIKEGAPSLMNTDCNSFLQPNANDPVALDNDLVDFTPVMNMDPNMNMIMNLDTDMLSGDDYLYHDNNNPSPNIPVSSPHEYTTTKTTSSTTTNSSSNKRTKKPISPPTSSKLSANTELTEEELYQRRKAQNRAAQRAFRERKEGKLKELSGKLHDAEVEREKLEKQLNDLKQKNVLLDKENQLLQQQQKQMGASSDYHTSNSSSKSPLGSIMSNEDNSGMLTNLTNASINKVLTFKFPNTNKSQFIDGTIDWVKHGHDRNNTVLEANKLGESYEFNEEKVLTISAIWDYLVEFSELNDDLSLDIPGIMKNLRGNEVCHGFGPAYPISLVNEIILNHLDEDD